MPRIYVGTYAKYNAGSIAGQWLDLEDYATATHSLKRAASCTRTSTIPN